MCPIEPTAAQVAELTAEYAAAAQKTAADLTANAPTTPTEPAAVIDTLNASKLPNLHGAHVESMRAEWIKAGLPAEQFDLAAKADGFEEVDDGISPAQLAHDQDHGVADEVAPSDYRVNYGSLSRTLSPERLAAMNTEATGWAAEMSLSPELGTAILEHIAENSPRVSALSPSAKAEWIDQQRAIGTRMAGGDKQYAEMRARAIDALKLAGDDHPFSAALERSSVLNSWWLISSLANHSAALDNWASSRPEK